MAFRLEQADLPLRTAEVVYIQIGSGALPAAIVGLLLGLRGHLRADRRSRSAS